MWISDWPARAACKGTDTDELFLQGAAQNRSKLICRGCPVRTECLADALDNSREFGVWGGMTARERRALQRRRPDVTSWRELLQRSRTVAEFEACYKAEFSRLHMFLLRQGIPYHEAMDAAQIAFTEALRQWENIQTPRPWLRHVAMRSVKRLPEFPVDEMFARDQPLLPDGIELKEQTRNVLDALARLPPQQRTVMAWTLDGFSPAEIADEINCTPEATRQNLHRARETLKRILRQLEEGQ